MEITPYGIELCLFAVSLLLGATCWDIFISRYEYDTRRVRAVMFAVLLATTVFEVALAARGLTHAWVAQVSVVVNVWGWLDAIMRFPAVPALRSFFTCKQISLIVVKAFAYYFGIQDFWEHVDKLLALMLTNIGGLPVLYITAFPLCPAGGWAKEGRGDVDLAVRLWQVAASPSERRRCIATCRRWWDTGLREVSERSALARRAVRAADTHGAQAYRRRGRSV